MPKALLLALVICSLASRASGEEKKPPLQHEARKNRVWSMWLNFETNCVQIDRVYIAKIKEDGELDPWQDANSELLIIQWTYDLPEPGTMPNYGAYDLLEDMAQTRYVVRIAGRGVTGKNFVKNIWVSPAGFSTKPIKLAPLRDLDSPTWNEDDWLALTNWYLREHEFSDESFFKKYKTILWHADRQLQLNVKIGNESCLQ